MKKDEYDYYNINALEELNIYENNETRLKNMKNNITLNKIISEVIKVYEKIGFNKEIFFSVIVKWISNFINSNNNEMTEIKKIFGEKLNIFSFFKYLVANCNIIIKAIELFNQIEEMHKGFTIKKYDYLMRVNIIYDFSENKNTSKNNSGESLYNLGKEIVNQLNEKKNDIEVDYKIYFYFNEKEEKFCETCSDMDLKEFVDNKYLAIRNFYLEILNENYSYMTNEQFLKTINELLYINNKLNEGDIYYLFLDNNTCYNIEIKDEKLIKEIFKAFTPILEENKYLIASFFRETSDNCNQPNYHDNVCLIKKKINEIIFNLIEPCLSLNLKLNSLFLKKMKPKPKYYYNLEEEKSKKIYMYNYNNYIINLNEMVYAILGTKYHSDSNLNSLFQIKAINYILNDNSNFVLFILELYNTLIKKRIKAKIEFIKNEKNIEEKFSIKIEKGKKYTKYDFDILKKKKEGYMKKIIEIKDIRKKQLKHNEKVQYKLYQYDTDIEYDNNFFPFESIYYFNEKILKHQNFDIFNDIINYKGKKHNYTFTNNFINVYDLIFTVKNIDKNNIIILEQNDIENILKNYSDKEMFNSLLNQNFSFKTKEELIIDITPIEFYLKGKKFK